jgi:hypothetical protein
MIRRIFLRTFLAVFLLVSFVCVAVAKSDASITTASTTTKSVAKHAHTVSTRTVRAEASKKSAGEMVHEPHLLPNGWRRSTEEVTGGTGY